MGRGRQEGHVRQSRKALGVVISEVSVNHGFLASSGGVGVTILVARETQSWMTCAIVVPRKGTTSQWWMMGRQCGRR